jgi:hypothetical protein
MNTKDVILIIIVFFALGFSLYRKYIKKNQNKTGYGLDKNSESSFPTKSDDDDYEPYANK